MLEPVWPDNAITTQRAPNSHFVRTKWVILMLMRLSLSPQAHILFVHVTTKVNICLVTEKHAVQEIRMVFISLIDGLPNGTSLSLICIGLKLPNM